MKQREVTDAECAETLAATVRFFNMTGLVWRIRSRVLTARLAAHSAPMAEVGGCAGLRAHAADGAGPVAVAVADENDLAPRVKTRLAGEMRHLSRALGRFGNAAQAIREELPLGADLAQLVLAFLGDAGLQFSDLLAQLRDELDQLAGGQLRIEQLGQRVDHFIREVDLDGRHFLAIALRDQPPRESANGLHAGNDGM